MSKKAVKVFIILVLIVIAPFALNLVLPKLTSDEARGFVGDLGILGPAAVMVYIIFSHIVAPISGTPMMVLSIALFGLNEALFYTYLASLASSIIVFYISKKFGRKWVFKLVGEKTMKKIDDFVEYAGVDMLILSRLFGFSIFDIVSYAAGLTRISFKKYFFITLVCSIPARIVFGYFFRNVDFGSLGGVIIWVGTLGLFAILFSLVVKMYIRKKQRQSGCG